MGRADMDGHEKRQTARLDEVLAALRAQRQYLERFGVKSLALFGSVARGEGGPGSSGREDVRCRHA